MSSPSEAVTLQNPISLNSAETVEEHFKNECENECKRLQHRSESECKALHEMLASVKLKILASVEANKENEMENGLCDVSVRIACQKGPYRGQVFTLQLKRFNGRRRSICLIGRSTGRKFKLPFGLGLPKDSEISTTHAEIALDVSGDVQFTDLNSTNGTIINGKDAIPQKAYKLSNLNPTIVEIGRSELSFSLV